MPGIPEKRGRFVGIVTSLALTGDGPGSAELLFTIRKTDGQKVRDRAFVFLAYPRHEGRVFAGAASILAVAYSHGTLIEVMYQRNHPTDLAIGLLIPPLTKRPKRKK